MKPLSPASAAALLTRIDGGTGCELRALSVIDPTTLRLRLSVQDRNRGFDWIDLVFEVSGVTDAALVEDGKLGFVDCSEGISLFAENGSAGVGVGSYDSSEALKSSGLYLLGSSLKFEEAEFSG
jgi:hypothetical protein